MPQVERPKLDDQENLVVRIPYGTGKSSDMLGQAALDSIRGLQSGGPISNLLYGVGVRTLRGIYFSSPGLYFFGLAVREAIHEEILPTLAELYKLSTWPEGWNGYDASAPIHEAIKYAASWICWLYEDIASLRLDWFAPNVTASAEGEVVFEWRRDKKHLTIYIGNQSAEYLKDWGMNVDTEMEDGYANSSNVRQTLWKWLIS